MPEESASSKVISSAASRSLVNKLIAKKETLFRRLQRINDLIPGMEDPRVQEQFLVSVQTVENTVKEYNSVVERIVDAEAELNSEYRPDYEALSSADTIYCNILTARKKLTALRSANQSISANSVQNESYHTRSSLPSIEIKPFKGDIKDWVRYRDIFTSIIINNGQLSNVERCHYLLSSLSDKALEVVKHFSPSEDNFDLAWTTLKNRYDSDRVLACHYLGALLEPVNPPSRPSVESLQSFLSKVDDNFEGLKLMKIPDLVGFIMYGIGIRQLDSLTRHEFERQQAADSFPTLSTLTKFVKSQCKVLELTSLCPQTSSRTSSHSSNFQKPPSRYNSRKPSVLVTNNNKLEKSPNSYSCPMCKQSHSILSCDKFSELTVEGRHEFVKQNRLCFNCCGNHPVTVCKSLNVCRYCGKKHHSKLHFHKKASAPAGTALEPASACVISEAPLNAAGTAESQTSLATSVVRVPAPDRRTVVLLGTASIHIRNKAGRFVQARALIDCASSVSFITQQLANRLQVQVQPCTQQFCGISSTPVVTSTGVIKSVIKPCFCNHPVLTINAIVIPSIVGQIPSAPLGDLARLSLEGIALADHRFDQPHSVDILIGCDLFPRILCSSPPPNSKLGLLPTIFGNVIIGPVPVGNASALSLTTISSPDAADEELNELVKNFFSVESVSSSPKRAPTDEWCENNFLETYKRDSSGRFVVSMPFKPNAALKFPESQAFAKQRFYSLESRFRKCPSLQKECVAFMNEYKNLGHMEEATRPGKYFIPYFCVFNSSSPTTPVRVVFDASAHPPGHLSLNQVLLPGPKLQANVADVLLNFRLYPFVFTCDITKMYRQILVEDSQRVYTHILFRDNPSAPLKEFELKTVTYGLTPSSFLAHRVLKELCASDGHKFPLAASALTSHCCVDDLLVGSNSLSGLFKLKNQLCALLALGQFNLNKWCSNSNDFLASLQSENASNSLVIRAPGDNSLKVLGVGWNPISDTFYFIIDPPAINKVYSKRQVLSTIARIYDPLSFAAPVVFLLKCLLKNIWSLNVNWDDALPPNICEQWSRCLQELPSLNKLQIPRCVFPSGRKSCHLIGCCDGSLMGSAAVIYLRVMDSNGRVNAFLLAAKTRVAPPKVETIPRLELIGAVLLAKLINALRPFLSKVPLDACFLLTDSTVVLSWINKSPHLLKVFVSHRVSLILDYTHPGQWYHIRSADNPADLASRGIMPSELANHPYWVKGHPWLYAPLHSWPIKSLNDLHPSEFPESLPEIRPVPVFATKPVGSSDLDVSLLSKYSSFAKLQRVVAYMLRFMGNATPSLPSRVGPLSTTELKYALLFCVHLDQSYTLTHERELLYSSQPSSRPYQALTLFIDYNSLIRVGGRLENSELSFDYKHPLLLAKNSLLAPLIVRYFHHLYLHAGPRTLAALVSQQFWIVNLRKLVRSVIHACTVCAKLRSTCASPPMGNLPAARITPRRPFLTCGVDLAGPFIVKETLAKKSRLLKAYFALFICMTTKAVHIEVVTGLSSENFIAALQRFSSRRGLPSDIYCDQGSGFRGAAKELKEVVSFLKNEAVKNSILDNLNQQGICFHFNVPYAPFMGGLWESNIKNVKYHLKRVIGQQILTLEEFSTLLIRIEAVLNSRPLCPLSTSPDETRPLTPAHFLIGSSLLAVPEYDLQTIPQNRLSRWQLVSQMSQCLWRRWEQEYLHLLQNKSKWFTPARNLEVGQLVWVKDENSKPLQYPLGRIITIHPGQDGIVRAVSVKTSSGLYVRPVRKLAPLPSCA